MTNERLSILPEPEEAAAPEINGNLLTYKPPQRQVSRFDPKPKPKAEPKPRRQSPAWDRRKCASRALQWSVHRMHAETLLMLMQQTQVVIKENAKSFPGLTEEFLLSCTLGDDRNDQRMFLTTMLNRAVKHRFGNLSPKKRRDIVNRTIRSCISAQFTFVMSREALLAYIEWTRVQLDKSNKHFPRGVLVRLGKQEHVIYLQRGGEATPVNLKL